MTTLEIDWARARGATWRDQLIGMEAMLSPIDGPLIESLQVDGPLRIADVGCGGGGTTLLIGRSAPFGSVVHGIDISTALVEAARSRLLPSDRGVEFMSGDATAACPPEGQYDRLVSRFAVMFFPKPRAAFENLASWLVPGGRFAFAVWGAPNDNPWFMHVAELAAEYVGVQLPGGDAPGPFRFAQASELQSLLELSGFEEVQLSEWRGSLALGGGLDADEAAAFAIAAFSIGEPVARAKEVIREQARRALAARLSHHVHDGVTRLNAAVHIVTGKRASSQVTPRPSTSSKPRSPASRKK